MLYRALSMLSGLALAVHVHAAEATGPAIHLFPSTVVEEIRHTGEVAEQMETGLAGIIGRLDQQQQLYLDARCQGAEGDPGCDRIAKNLGATYLEMLGVMNERLPDMERAVNATRASLEGRLRAELGQRMSPWTLQETLLGGSTATSGTSATSGSAQQPALRGRSGMRLSERFKQYYQLVAHSGASSDQSLAVVAADMYLDMHEASNLLAQTREEIARATLMEQLNQSFGLITPEMQKIMGGVKTILFGDEGAADMIASPRPGGEGEPYRSPLEM
jgi:hypothetical protein